MRGKVMCDVIFMKFWASQETMTARLDAGPGQKAGPVVNLVSGVITVADHTSIGTKINTIGAERGNK